MANVNLNIPDGVLNRVLDAVASEYNYNAATDGTKAAFAKKQVIEFLKRTVRDYEISQQVNNSNASITADVEANVSIS